MLSSQIWMKISLNINNFSGLKYKGQYKKENKYKEWLALDETSESTEILAYIRQEKPVIEIFHQFELNANIAQQIVSFMAYIFHQFMTVIFEKN